MITLTIDDQEIQVKEGRTLLEAAREQGIPIPTLCYHEALEPFAACRMCIVELENRRGGQLVPACAYSCEEGLVVHTNSERVRSSRRMTIELLMASAAHVPLIRAMAEEFISKVVAFVPAGGGEDEPGRVEVAEAPRAELLSSQ